MNINSQKIEKREISDELRDSYLDYAMSVIVARALPDIRDGLKPVHRRILWTMWEDGLTHSARFRKSANVVGTALARYHPHGDTAVYDSLVRMAQDFSLRYPLVQGQGNFGCFTKDTKVKLTDGRNLSFGELIEEDKNGGKNYTYTVNQLGLISIAEIKNPRLTKNNAEIMKVVLDDGEEIKCTLNHRFMLRDGSYKEAKDLKPGESLMPIYQKLSEKTDRINRDGYVLIYQNKKNEWVPTHHLADNYNLSAKKYSKSSGRVRHHMDFNKLNNNPDNIIRTHWGKHWRMHHENASLLHQNEEYRNKIAEGRKKYWSLSENREKYSKRLSIRNAQNWQIPEYREKMRQILSDVNKEYIKNHPEKRIELSQRASNTLKRLWKNPNYRKLFHEKIVNANKKRITNNTGRVKFLKVCKEVLSNCQSLNEELYEQIRNKVYPYARATSWDTGFKKYYDSKKDLLFKELNYNHKVIGTEFLNQKEDVYDLTIEGTHNFALAAGIFVHNSLDGDNAAAMRYTEARLSKIAGEMLFDIDKETVDWNQNYDSTRQEPKVMPAKLPNLLLNGTMGIAVGMATNIPPHNLNEVIDATIHLIEHPKAETEDLLQFIQGPDFPTGGIIYNKKSIIEAYTTGRGPVTTRAAAEIEEAKNGQFIIVITEIPYQVNKSELIIKMAQLAQDKKIEGIRDIRDESDRQGLRIVVEIKSGASAQKILNQLYQHTDLQKDFHFNMIALAGGIQPRLVSLKEILEAYVSHRQEIVERRAKYDLKKAKERAHILEGLVKALANIDKIIALIKKAKNSEEAHQQLMSKFGLTDIQATAILEMKLRALAALERQKIEDELKEKKRSIKDLEELLKSPRRILEMAKNELLEIKKNYGDERRTKVVAGGLREFSEKDLIPKEDVVISLSKSGYIKRLPPTSFRAQRRGGKGLIGSEVGEEDFITHFLAANTHDNILFFTEKGKVFQAKAHEIPVGSRTAKGKLTQNFLDIPADEHITAIVSYDAEKHSSNAKSAEKICSPTALVMATKNGVIKKTPIDAFANVRRTGIIAMNLPKDDQLKWVSLACAGDEVLLTTSQGQSIRFKESQLRAMGRNAAGVRGIRLKKADAKRSRSNDFVAGMDIIKGGKAQNANCKLLIVTENGFAKQTFLKEYKTQSRGGMGIKTAKITSKTGALISAHVITEQQELLALSTKGQVIKTQISSIRTAGRATSGVKIMNLKAGDKVAGVICL